MSSSSSHSGSRNNHLYRSQQNLSTTRNFSNHSSTTSRYQLPPGSNRAGGNQSVSSSNFHNQNARTYGSASNIAVLERNLNTANFSVARQNSNNNTQNGSNNNNNFVHSASHNNSYRANNNSNTNTTNNNNNSRNYGLNGGSNNVDNWLNAWDNPPPQVPSAPVAAKRTQFNYSSSSSSSTLATNAFGPSSGFDMFDNSMSSNNNNNINSTTINPLPMYNKLNLPLKPIQVHGTSHHNRNVNDPWSGLNIFFSVYFSLLFIIHPLFCVPKTSFGFVVLLVI